MTTWLIVGYIVIAMISNLAVSVWAIRDIQIECARRDVSREVYENLMSETFDKSETWLESHIPLPAIFDPLIKTVFFPFNIATILECRRKVLKMLDDSRSEQRS